MRVPCALVGGHTWSVLHLEPGRAFLTCARCAATSTGWDLAGVLKGPANMRLDLTVCERAAQSDGTIRITFVEPGGSTLELRETADRPYQVGDRYELTLTRVGPTPADPRRV